MKKMYISPSIMVRDTEEFMLDPNDLIDNSWGQDVDPDNDPETDQPVRTRKSLWDTDDKEENS